MQHALTGRIESEPEELDERWIDQPNNMSAIDDDNRFLHAAEDGLEISLFLRAPPPQPFLRIRQPLEGHAQRAETASTRENETLWFAALGQIIDDRLQVSPMMEELSMAPADDAKSHCEQKGEQPAHRLMKHFGFSACAGSLFVNAISEAANGFDAFGRLAKFFA